MKQRRRIYYSAAQRAEIWDRWQADLADRRHSACNPAAGSSGAQSWRAGGDIPRAQRPLFASADRQLLGRSPSTISREILRNGGPDRYRAARSTMPRYHPVCPHGRRHPRFRAG
jgi:hypothetical protein